MTNVPKRLLSQLARGAGQPGSRALGAALPRCLGLEETTREGTSIYLRDRAAGAAIGMAYGLLLAEELAAADSIDAALTADESSRLLAEPY